MSVLLDDRCPTANRSGPVPNDACRRARRPGAAALALLLAAGLGACTVGPDTGPDPEVEAAPYPALSTVPPRPRLSYSIDQRREIAQALVSDRENARYDRSVARYELGLDDAPPAEQSPVIVAEPEPPDGGVEAKPVPPAEPLPPGGGEIADMAIRQQVLLERNSGRIETFLLILERQLQFNQQAEAAGIGVLPDIVQPNTLPGRPPEGSPQATAPAAPAEEDALFYLRKLFGSSEEPNSGPAEQTAQPAATPTDTASLEPGAGPTAAARAEATETAVVETEAAETPAAEPEVTEAVAAPAQPAATAATEPPVEAAAAPAVPATARPPMSGPIALTFAPRSRELPSDAEATLRQVAEAAHAENLRLVVEGHGASPALSLDRARSVASWLMRLGAPPDMVTLKGGGAGEDVIVHLLPAGAA